MIVRSDNPPNIEFDFSQLDSFITPTDQFFVRNHFDYPGINPGAWRLNVDGAVRRPLELSLDEIRQMDSRTVPLTFECAGNGRGFLTETAPGVQWELGAVGTAEWTGVPLSAVLENAGIDEGAVEAVMEGADSGLIREDPRPAGPINYARSISLSLAPEVLLAYRMNGEELSIEHGYPLRAVVPGWYGMAAIKWLSRIIVVDRPFQGYYQSVDYAYWERRNGLPTRVPITEMQLKAEISRPSPHETVSAGSRYLVRGAAWGGSVERVLFSGDSGKTWDEANLIAPAIPHSWVLWQYDWLAPSSPGRCTIMARAATCDGCEQPLTRDHDRANYMISHVLPIVVDII